MLTLLPALTLLLRALILGGLVTGDSGFGGTGDLPVNRGAVLESFNWERFLWAPLCFLTEHLLQEEQCPLRSICLGQCFPECISGFLQLGHSAWGLHKVDYALASSLTMLSGNTWVWAASCIFLIHPSFLPKAIVPQFGNCCTWGLTSLSKDEKERGHEMSDTCSLPVGGAGRLVSGEPW